MKLVMLWICAIYGIDGTYIVRRCWKYGNMNSNDTQIKVLLSLLFLLWKSDWGDKEVCEVVRPWHLVNQRMVSRYALSDDMALPLQPFP